MAKCPQCGKYYDDAMSFCLDDGSYLLADRHTPSDVPTAEYRNTLTESDQETETVIGRPVPTISNVRASGTSPSAVIVVGLFIVGGLVLIGAIGFAGFLFYKASGGYERSTSTPLPPVRSSPTPLDILGGPIKTRDDTTYPDNKIKKDPRTVDIRTEGTGINANTPGPPPLTLRERPENSATRKPIPKQISGGVLNGKATSLPKPPYPPAARAVRASGSVTVQVLVNESGNVVSARAVSGHPLLRAAAVSAARGAKFSPTMLSGQPVKISGIITYNFVAP